MKTSVFVLLAGIGFSTSLMAQNNTSPRPFYNALNTNYAMATQSQYRIAPETYHYSEWSVGSDGRVKRSRAYMNGRHNRNTGIGLLVGGAIGLTGGVALLTDGVIGLRKNRLFSNTGISSVGRFYEVYFGAAFTAAGIAMVIPGAVLLPRGMKQMRRAQERMAAP